jgi:TolB-like protein/Flp pilus assembly protein TadD
MISERVAFLIPVVIDATRDAEADVPTEFRAVQSTKLPGGEASGTFITRVQMLLGGPSAPIAPSFAISSQPSEPARAARSGLPHWVSAALGAGVVALMAFVALRLSGKDAAPASKPVAETIPAAAEVPAPVSAGSTLLATDKSVAVLAFANLSDDKANEYFSDGISEDLLNVLAKVPGLKVTARTSSFYFKGKQVPIPEIAKQLGVAYVVEGSVQKSGSKVRISAQLIKAEDGFHVWSDTFTREMKDVFDVQDEIASLIARNLRAKMALGRERAAVAPETYALVLQARQAAARQTIDGGREAVKLYREVLALALDDADAWAELAYVYQYLARFGGMDTGEGMREARLAARKALELDPEQPLGLAAFGWVQRTDEHDWRGAQESFRHALAAAPENVAIMSDAAICFLNVGLIEESVVLADRAAERDPLNPKAHWTRGIVLAFSGKLAQAEAPYRRAIELAPAADEYHSHLARVLTALNRLDEAKVVVQAEPSERYRLSTLAGIYYQAGDTATAERLTAELIAKYSDSMAGNIASVYAQAGHRDEAFKWLERAYENRDSAVAWVKTSYFLDKLHDDPRWPVFLHKMGLADDQLN